MNGRVEEGCQRCHRGQQPPHDADVVAGGMAGDDVANVSESRARLRGKASCAMQETIWTINDALNENLANIAISIQIVSSRVKKHRHCSGEKK